MAISLGGGRVPLIKDFNFIQGHNTYTTDLK